MLKELIEDEKNVKTNCKFCLTDFIKKNKHPVTFITDRLDYANQGRLSKMAELLANKQKPLDQFLNHAN